ncbi:MAG TPA: hypothetical protein VJW20_00330 [Candidatus Angelobacter sp.]|nr:hypothetical protein [Candidatus Angelobacter sp.]
MKKDTTTKEEIIRAIKECADELGHPPSFTELAACKGIHQRQIRRHFLTYKRALAECGMMREGTGYKVPEEALFKDWAELVRKLQKVPNMTEYEAYSKYSQRPLMTRFGTWRQAQMGLLALAQENGWEMEWKDVLDVLREHLRQTGQPVRTFRRPGSGSPDSKILPDRLTYGPPLMRVPLAHGPTNEQGVLFLFGAIGEDLGFLVTHVQTKFPDVEAMREVAPGVWQRVDIEVEEYSRNFVTHLHDPNKCDLIVCWEHNWPECPLEVIELKTEFERLQRERRRKTFTTEDTEEH